MMRIKLLALIIFGTVALTGCGNDTKTTESALYRTNGSWMSANDYSGGTCLASIDRSTAESIELIGFLPNKFVTWMQIGKQSPEWLKSTKDQKEHISEFYQDVTSSIPAEISVNGSKIDVKLIYFGETALVTFNYDKNQDQLVLNDIQCNGKCQKTYIPNTPLAKRIKDSGGIKYKFCPAF